LCSATLECAEALFGLDTALQQGRLSLAGDAVASFPGQNQLLAALTTIRGCLLFTTRLQLPRNDAFRIAKSFLQLAFGSGQAALAAAAEAARAVAPDRYSEAHVRKMLTSSIVVVFSIGTLLPTSRTTSARPEPIEFPCYSMAAQAESWVPWLATVADAMLLCYTPPGKTGQGWLGTERGVFQPWPHAGSACCYRLKWRRLLPRVRCRRARLAWS
jgi:hypothetical protein